MRSLSILFAAVGSRVLSRRGRLSTGRVGAGDLVGALADCRQVFELAYQLQQHRGMSSAWLAGECGFMPALRDKGALVETLFPGLLRLARREGAEDAPCLNGNDVSLFIFHWRSLVETLDEKQAEQSIAEHTQLISTLLAGLALLGERRIEPLLAGGRLGMARSYAQRLPALSECLGQVRAVGSSVAARQACSPVARVRLMFLIGRAEAMLEQAAQANDRGRVTLLARSAIRELTFVVRTAMLLSDGVSVPPEQFYAVASQAIERVVAWLEQTGQALLESSHAAEALAA